MAYGTVNADVISTSVANTSLGAGNATRFKNRIINGDMRIDQRNAGASVSTSSGTYIYTLDRWQALYSATSKFTVQQNAGSVTPPAGYINYLGVTSTSAYSVSSGDYFAINQRIEGLNTADFGWGTANAQAVTLSFWVRSSLTGAFGGVIQNSANNRSYPFSYTILSANTWTQISVTIPGDTTGTWLTTNGIGIQILFGLGVGTTYSGTSGSWSGSNYVTSTGAVSVVGTSGATFYITGVQLEVGSSATGFDYRDFGTELLMCQRYFEKSYNLDVKPGTATSVGPIVNFPTQYVVQFFACYKVPKRAEATATYYSPLTGASGNYTYNYTNDAAVTAISTGQTSSSCYAVTPGNVSAYLHFTASAEL